MIVCFAWLVSIVPLRVVSLPTSRAVHILEDWRQKNSDERLERELSAMQSACTERSTKRGTIGLIDERGACRALATFVNPPLTLTHLMCDDDRSGTLLMCAIVKTAKIETADTLHDRWKLAEMWFQS